MSWEGAWPGLPQRLPWTPEPLDASELALVSGPLRIQGTGSSKGVPTAEEVGLMFCAGPPGTGTEGHPSQLPGLLGLSLVVPSPYMHRYGFVFIGMFAHTALPARAAFQNI